MTDKYSKAHLHFYEKFYELFGELCQVNQRTEKIKFAEIFSVMSNFLTNYLNTKEGKNDPLKIDMVILKKKLDVHKKDVLNHRKILEDMSPLINKIIDVRKK
ncbi:MAG TPA: hypothetical protein VEC16_01570 [Alphaproteobacteria bacterium]|nr:hypothetical protein [Alphaproteobacteria bacterium]